MNSTQATYRNPLFIIGCLIIGGIWTLQALSRRANDPESFLGEESKMMRQIKDASTVTERQRLIAELEALPEKHYSFWQRWLSLYGDQELVGWSSDGFDSTKSPLPRDIQLLAATIYGINDINNGGLHQFFHNSTGVHAPEMVEWLNRAGYNGAAEVLLDAMKVFGEPYPRSRDVRTAFLDGFGGEGSRDDWDPFAKLDDRFQLSLGSQDELDAACDRWLRTECGVTSLSDGVTPVPAATATSP